jgi:hypothetical protein
MLNLSRPSSVRTLMFCLLAALAGSTANGQTTSTPLDRQLARIDLGISGVGSFNSKTSGTVTVNTQPTTVTLSPGNTLGALVTLRYTRSPFVGLEFNYGYSRYTQTFTPFGAQPIGGVQQNATEYTLGYVAHPRDIFGVHPFVAGGGGAIAFRPTPGGGLGLQPQVRGAYYYALGAETTVLSPHFGVRVQFRQVFFTAPDFFANYLATGKRTSTLEPGVGFFLKF